MLARKAFEDFDALYNEAAEQELLAELIEPMYSRMHRAVHQLVETTFPPMEGFRLDDEAARDLLAHAAQQVVRIDEVTRTALREQLAIGQERGYSAWQIAHGVPTEGYPGIDGLFMETWKDRGLTVARNELLEAQHLASAERYRATGMVDRVQLRDGTGTAPDQPCLARNGQVLPFGDMLTPPPRLHINCSVVMIPILVGDPSPPPSAVPPVILGEPSSRST